jgi:hypothetical protein
MGCDAPGVTNTIDSNPGMAHWKQFSRMGDFTLLKPVDGWIFSDESMYSLNDGWMQMDLNNTDFPDVPANYHGGIDCFSFADGHGEPHKWLGALKSTPYAKGVCVTAGAPSPWAANGSAASNSDPKAIDWGWIELHSSFMVN